MGCGYQFIVAFLCVIALGCSSSEPQGVGGGSAVEAPDANDSGISPAQSRAGASYAFVDSGDVHVARNPSQKLHITMRDGGARVERTDRPSDWVELRWTGYGRGTDVSEPTAPTAATAADNRVTFQHGAEEAWYLNGPLGLEHGFHLPNPTIRGIDSPADPKARGERAARAGAPPCANRAAGCGREGGVPLLAPHCTRCGRQGVAHLDDCA